jgi:hypothetical protein
VARAREEAEAQARAEAIWRVQQAILDNPPIQYVSAPPPIRRL